MRPERTSALAAVSQSPRKNAATADAVLALLAQFGPMVDHELFEKYHQAIDDGAGYPLASPQSVRTRRHELVKAGQVIAAGRGRSLYGRPSTIWGLAQPVQHTRH